MKLLCCGIQKYSRKDRSISLWVYFYQSITVEKIDTEIWAGYIYVGLNSGAVRTCNHTMSSSVVAMFLYTEWFILLLALRASQPSIHYTTFTFFQQVRMTRTQSRQQPLTHTYTQTHIFIHRLTTRLRFNILIIIPTFRRKHFPYSRFHSGALTAPQSSWLCIVHT